MAKRRDPRIHLAPAVDLLHEHLTSALIDDAFQARRTRERKRLWGLEQVAFFWTAVLLDPPPSLRQALSEALGTAPRYPAPASSPQAFFARTKNLKWEFLQDVFVAFRRRVTADAPRVFARSLAPLFDRFAHIQAVDGSRLDGVARRLKALWRDRRVPLAGSIVAFADLATGTLDQLIFDPDANASEFVNAKEALKNVPAGTLLVGDRLYGVVRWFEALGERSLHGVMRRFGPVQIERVRLLSRTPLKGNDAVEDWEVIAGTGQTAPPQRLRLIRVMRSKQVRFELLTNVLDPLTLSAEEALAVYRCRWKVERLFSDLKEVLNLHHFYAANTNAIGQQVYATAILHTALRVAQGLAAQQAGIEPEEISTKKFFPKVATASACLTWSRLAFQATRRANPGLDLKEPAWDRMAFAYARLKDVRVEIRRSKKGTSRRRPALRAHRPMPPRPHDANSQKLS